MSSYSPLNLNCIGAFINNHGLRINSNARQYMGFYDGYYLPGILTDGNFLHITPGIFERAFDVRFPVKSMGQLIPGKKYYIRSLGTTDFTLVGAAANRVGREFKATSTGADIAGTTGTCNDISSSDQTGMTFDQHANLLRMGHSIPLITNTPPYRYNKDYYSTSCKHGFIGQFAVQAFEEFYINNGSYTDFFNSFASILGFKETTNNVIDSLNLSLSHLDGIYSNMNDLITSDITGVTISTFFWGQDLVRLGRAMDLQSIQNFGNPDNLLRILAKNKAITPGLNIALSAAGLDPNDMIAIINGKSANNEQQKLLYASYNLISGSDLDEILTPLNCRTKRLDSLADLLNLKKIFPTSYQTLTFPQYNSEPKTTNSKTYYLLYAGTQVNKIPSLSYGSRLAGIIPADIGYAADAFSMSMRQIKNIQNIDIEKFAQVVTNLENVNDLAVNGTSTPTNKEAVLGALGRIAYGTGENGRYRTLDFFASMTDLYYPWKKLEDAITTLQELPEIVTLQGYLQDIYNALPVSNLNGAFTPVTFTDTIQPKIDQINILVDSIYFANKDIMDPIIELYDRFGSGLNMEQYVRKQAIPGGIEYTTSSITDIYSFIDSLSTYSSETQAGETAVVLENIIDGSTLGGQSLVGSMREARNSERMGLMGGELDNKVQTTPLQVPIPNGTKGILPTTTGNVEVLLDNGGPVIGSLAGSPQSTLIPSNLNILNMATGPSVLVPSAAIQHVSKCNCDCWDLLQ
jgi:hypothetical protein